VCVLHSDIVLFSNLIFRPFQFSNFSKIWKESDIIFLRCEDYLLLVWRFLLSSVRSMNLFSIPLQPRSVRLSYNVGLTDKACPQINNNLFRKLSFKHRLNIIYNMSCRYLIDEKYRKVFHEGWWSQHDTDDFCKGTPWRHNEDISNRPPEATF